MPPKPAIIRPAPEIRKASFLPGGFPGAIATSGKPASVAFAGAAINTSSPLNNFSATRDRGPEDPSRQIIVLVRGYNANLVTDGNFTTQVTVAGAAATRVYAPASNAQNHWTAWITSRQDSGGPTGASG